ncbi:A/G-specific adenine glycosylase [Nemorincola caseinilytica]|uniref:Adenine DNA glycosylase n=1 Tax=Nemorincola caseinilytica TaxID=2054315 RepID=A0ABP8N1W7_9BACT
MTIAPGIIKFFRTRLHSWHTGHNSRQLPWKGEKDPYRIWLSEIILQQTRALQGLPYYESFTGTYPTVQALAAAADEDVFRLWQGLGYYNRCKNMLATARYIATELGGHFPRTHEGILALKGVGPYTAAAISSFAYGLPHAVVDGNVYRVLSRFLGIDTPFDTTAGKHQFATAAQLLLDETDSAAHNQAIMDLGATICTPAAPRCADCPLHSKCFAAAKDMTALLPVRSKKIVVKERFFNYIFLLHDGKVWIEKRGAGDIWESLHQPYLAETEKAVDVSVLRQDVLFDNKSIRPHELTDAGMAKQRLTHQLIHCRFYIMHLTDMPMPNGTAGMWLSISELKKLAFPKILVSFLRNNLYF